jgi:hypothetical protein
MMDLSCGRGRSLSCEREPPEAAAGGAGPGGCTDIGGWGKQSILEGERRQARRDETRGDGWGRGRDNAVLAIGAAAATPPSRRLGLAGTG